MTDNMHVVHISIENDVWGALPSVRNSGSQICSNRYPNQDSDYILLPITLNVLRREKYTTEQHCGFGFALPPEESHITPRGNLSHFGNHWSRPRMTVAWIR